MPTIRSTPTSLLPNPGKGRVAHVVPEAIRCMQCGICSYNCPAGIDVRGYAWHGLPVDDSRCLLCGQCVVCCPRRALHVEPMELPGKVGR